MKRTALLMILPVVFFALTACKTQTISNNQAVSEYPLIPSALAQAEIKRLDETTFKLEDRKGKVVLVNLWATWCGPCRQEIPKLVEFQEAYRDKGFEIIGLDVDPEPVEKIKEFTDPRNVNYELGWASDEVIRQAYKISRANGIPQSLLIDRGGHLRGVFVGGSDKVINQLQSSIEKVVSE